MTGICLLHGFSAGPVEVPVSSLPHISGAQRLLAEGMILMVTQFHREVVEFFPDGRNSGQDPGEKEGADTRWLCDSTQRSARLRPFTHQLLRLGS